MRTKGKIVLSLALTLALVLGVAAPWMQVQVAKAAQSVADVTITDPAPVSGSFTITFSEDVKVETTAAASGSVVLNAGSTNITATISSVAGRVVTVSYAGLSFNTLYTIVINNFKNTADEVMTEDRTKTFTTVKQPAVISEDPKGVSVSEGQTATFTVKATGAESYQWQKHNGSSFENITGATNSSYSIANVSMADNNTQYRVVVKGYDGVEVLSTSARLTISPVQITSQPVDVSAGVGRSASFSVTATGNIASYQWELSTDDGKTFSKITGATGSSYMINSVTRLQNGYKYRVIVTPSSGAAITSNVAKLTVTESGPVIIYQPYDTIRNIGERATFAVTVEGTAPIYYQWHISTNNGSTWSSISGANSSVYTTDKIDSSMDGYRYRVYVYNVFNQIWSYEAKLTVRDATRYTVMFMNQGNVQTTREVAKNAVLGSSWPANPSRSGYTFVGWNTRDDGTGTYYDKNTKIDGDLMLYAIWKDKSGSTGGGAGTGTPSTATDVTVTAAENAGRTAATEAKAKGQKTATAKLKNPAKISAEALAAMRKAAGMTTKLYADSLKSGSSAVDVRITLDPSKAKNDLNLAASTVSDNAKYTVSKFKNFKNDKMAVSFSQSGNFGQTVTVSVKLESHMDSKGLVVYKYDRAKNTYSKVTSTVKVDSNRYAVFSITSGGDYLITEGNLRK